MQREIANLGKLLQGALPLHGRSARLRLRSGRRAADRSVYDSFKPQHWSTLLLKQELTVQVCVEIGNQ